jgi:predicted nuclease of restriction endonuclease-like RecB superfamily
MALFLPAVIQCRDFRLDAELRWGPRREPRHFLLTGADGLVSHLADPASFQPPELTAFVERFAQVAPAWQLSEATDLIELGREGLWIPDYRAVHRATGLDVYIEVLGFWKRASLDRLLGLLPRHGPPRYLLALSERLKVDEEALAELPGPVLRFREIPNAPELAERLEQFLPPDQRRGRARNRAASDPQGLF